MKKTKEMPIDKRKSHKFNPAPIAIKGTNVERKSQYKYLGIMFDDELSWKDHCDYILKKINRRFYCFRKLSHFKVDNKILRIFFQAVICSVWQYCFVGWGGNARQVDLSRIQSVIRRASRVIGECQSVDSYYHDSVERTLHRVMGDDSHPLHDVFRAAVIPRSGRMRQPHLVTNRYHDSFIPSAIRQFNVLHNR